MVTFGVNSNLCCGRVHAAAPRGSWFVAGVRYLLLHDAHVVQLWSMGRPRAPGEQSELFYFREGTSSFLRLCLGRLGVILQPATWGQMAAVITPSARRNAKAPD